MNKNTELPEIGTPTFWNLYDRFCNPVHLQEFVETGQSGLIDWMCQIMETSHRAGSIHHISSSERGWDRHKAWLTLRNAHIRNDQGDPVLYMRVGDVIVVEQAWNRDVVITHNPIELNRTSGYLLGGKWEEMVGLFMPLFDRATIMKCIDLRLKKNTEEAFALAKEEAQDWQWY